MEALRRSCQVGVCLVCRCLLGAIVITVGLLVLLEMSFTDFESSVPVDDVPLQWLDVSTTSPQTGQTLTWSNVYEPNDEQGMQTTTQFRMSLMVDVTIDSAGGMVLTVLKETAAISDDSRTRQATDETSDSHRTRMRAVGLADSALRAWSADQGDNNSSRQLQQLNIDEKVDMKQNVGQWLHKLAGDRLHPLHVQSKMHMFAMWMTCLAGVACMLAPCMMQGPFRPPHPAQHGMRSNVHQSDAGPPFVGTATLKVPPSWSVERNHIYSLRAWISDLILWASASDLDPMRHGPIAALQIQGTAKELVRELTPQQLQHGDIDPQTGAQYTGLMLLVNILARRYAPLEAENTTKSISEFLSFKRMPGVHFFGAEMEQLRSISEVGSVVSSAGSRKRASEPAGNMAPDQPSRAVPKFSPGFFPNASGIASAHEASVASAHDASGASANEASVEGSSPEVEKLVAGARDPQSPPPSRPPKMTSIRLGVSSSADVPTTSQDVPIDAVTPKSSSEKPSKMSREEQNAVRQQSVQGLHQLMMGVDQMAGRHDAIAGAHMQMNRQVLNLETQLANPPQSMQMMVGSQSFAFGVPGMNPNIPFPGLFSSGSNSSGAGIQSHFPGPPSSGTFPWWEVDALKDDDAGQKSATEGTYHLRTRLRSGAVGLLVDPGAHDNLIGEITAKQMCNELNTKLESRTLDKPLPVEGVGKSAQVADKSACVRMSVCSALGSMNDASYTAPIIPDSMLPPLLGNKTLRKMQVILDCGSGKMIIPGPGGIEVKMSPGSHVYELELSNSGHWILPLHARDPSAMSTAERDLAFNMSCRQNRPPSVQRRAKSAEGARSN
eukprot:s730_g13.t1